MKITDVILVSKEPKELEVSELVDHPEVSL